MEAFAVALLDSEIVALALPVGHLHLVLASEQNQLLAALPTSLIVSYLAHHIFKDDGGSWLGLAAVLCAQCGLLGLLRRGWRLTGLLLTFAAVAFAAPPGTVLDSESMSSAQLGLLALGAAAVVASAPALARAGRALAVFTTGTAWRSSAAAIALLAACMAQMYGSGGGLLSVFAAVASASLHKLLPISEFALAYETVGRFVGEPALTTYASTLALVTIHAQVSVGRLGVSYLRTAQLRKNRLLAVGAEDVQARVGAAKFTRSVCTFVLLTAVPYAVQRTVFESINAARQRAIFRRVDNAMRLGVMLADGPALSATAASNHTVDMHSDQLKQLLTTTFVLLERKIFSLPKLALLPGVVSSHPALTTIGLPFIVLVDAGKSYLSTKLTEKHEEHRRAQKVIQSTMRKVEAHDLAHASQIIAADAFELTRSRWEELVEADQRHDSAKEMFRGLRQWLGWLYWQDVLQPGIEAGIAWLLEAGHIGLADVWLYCRVIEDSVDFLLMRSRAEAQLAMVSTDAKRLISFDQEVKAAQAADRVQCSTEGGGSAAPPALTVDCEFSRGDARVRASGIVLPPGIYALAGRNGCGKSSFLSILASCSRGGHLMPGVALHSPPPCAVSTSYAGPIVEVPQRPYCPLHSAPIRWLGHAAGGQAESHASLAHRAASELHRLRFISNGEGGGEGGEEGSGAIASLASTLLAEADDYCGGLSGGQRAKLELVRSVFMRDSCPSTLLLDEPFAPLDPSSKTMLMRRLRAFCNESVVLVVYHSEADHAVDDGTDDDASPRRTLSESEEEEAVCEAGGGTFFDAVIALKGGALQAPKTCRGQRASA